MVWSCRTEDRTGAVSHMSTGTQVGNTIDCFCGLLWPIKKGRSVNVLLGLDRSGLVWFLLFYFASVTAMSRPCLGV